MFNNQRNTQRINVFLPIQLSFGTQIVLQGQMKDLSAKSTFVIIKSSIHMECNDDLTFLIENLPNNIEGSIQGSARISRVVPGEGIAIYFTKMDEKSAANLQRLMGQNILNK
jgi:hypothetical protein